MGYFNVLKVICNTDLCACITRRYTGGGEPLVDSFYGVLHLSVGRVAGAGCGVAAERRPRNEPGSSLTAPLRAQLILNLEQISFIRISLKLHYICNFRIQNRYYKWQTLQTFTSINCVRTGSRRPAERFSGSLVNRDFRASGFHVDETLCWENLLQIIKTNWKTNTSLNIASLEIESVTNT